MQLIVSQKFVLITRIPAETKGSSLAACGDTLYHMHMQVRVSAYETWPMKKQAVFQAWPYCGIASQLQERLPMDCS